MGFPGTEVRTQGGGDDSFVRRNIGRAPSRNRRARQGRCADCM